jgi:phage head maturation protease
MLMRIAEPRGWTAESIERRFTSNAPSSYDGAAHSCRCIISTGAVVDRFYGREILAISDDAVDLSRLPCPLLDSHSQASISDVLGRIDSAWISGGQLHGEIVFAQTPRGRLAENMVERGEVRGISAGYKVSQWAAVDADGDPVDPSRTWDDNLTFTATRWQLLECSLVSVPADGSAMVRSLGGDGSDIADIRARMLMRQRMLDRQLAAFGARDD